MLRENPHEERRVHAGVPCQNRHWPRPCRGVRRQGAGAIAVKALPAKPAATTPAARRRQRTSHRRRRRRPVSHTPLDVNGVRLAALVDTGATYMVLSAEDAARARIAVSPADFTPHGLHRQWPRKGCACLFAGGARRRADAAECRGAGRRPGGAVDQPARHEFLGRLSKMEASAGRCCCGSEGGEAGSRTSSDPRCARATCSRARETEIAGF